MGFCDREFDARCDADHFCEVPALDCWPCKNLCKIKHHQEYVEKCKRVCRSTYDAIYGKIESTVETVTQNVRTSDVITETQHSTSETQDEAWFNWNVLGMLVVIVLLLLLVALIIYVLKISSKSRASRRYHQVANYFDNYI